MTQLPPTPRGIVPGFIPRKRYPMVATTQNIITRLVAAGMPRREAQPIGRAFGSIFEKMATDEFLNYHSIEQSLGSKEYATIVIAASDSEAGETQVDFRCTGTADNLTIQTALETLPEAGGKVVLLEGIYEFDGDCEIPPLPAAIWIQGMGAGTSIRITGGGFTGTGQQNTRISHLRMFGGDVTLEPLAIDLNGAKLYLDHCNIEVAFSGVKLTGTRGQVHDNIFRCGSSTYYNLEVVGGQYIVYDNLISFTSPNGSGGILLEVDDSLIANNTVINTGKSACIHLESGFSGGERNLFIGNLLIPGFPGAPYAIRLDAGTVQNFVVGNYIVPGSSGSRFDGGTGNRFAVNFDGTNIVGSHFTYIHTQAIANATWTITHNLGAFPSVTVVDGSLIQVIGDVQYVNNNELIVTFNSAQSGLAYLN